MAGLKRALNQTAVYLLAAVVIFADQYSKHVVRSTLEVNQAWSPAPGLAHYARILHIQNTGAAFGMFKDGGLIFTVMASIVSLIIVYYAARLPAGHWGLRLALGLQLGGAVGNLIDRLVFGPVTDFISVGSFAIFNVADASISVGVAVLVLLMILEARSGPPAPAAAPAGPADVGEPS